LRVVIVGGGSAGWMVAAALARFLARGHAITLVESEELGTVGVGEATIPQIRLFNRALGLDESQFLKATGGSIKLGIEFVDWTTPGSRYIHGFGPVGRDLGLVPFHHWWLRGHQAGLAEPFGAYCANIAAAWVNRFAPVEGPGALVHAYHFDAGLYAKHLREVAEGQGVTRVEGRIEGVDAAGNHVSAVQLADGRRVEGDLFIDCSGFRSLLLGEALGTPFLDWSHWLPCDRALAVPSARTEPLLPYTRATARPAGWQWRIPLQHRTGNGHVFSSAFMGEDEAQALLLANLDGAALDDARLLRFRAGRRADFWRGNVVAIGLASGFLEPLESTSIHLVQSAIERLLQLWPGADPAPALAESYNRQTVFEFERIRDFLILHYHANARSEPLWQHVRHMELPDTLAGRLELFRATGRIIRDGNELFAEPGWSQVLIGQGVMARDWHPLAGQLSEADLADFLSMIVRMNRERALRLPDHGDWLMTLSAVRKVSA
jgi:tryptophan halogenase